MTATAIVGWAILESLWQDSVIALLALAAFAITRRSAASTRYLIAVIALGAMLGVPVATVLSSDSPSTTVYATAGSPATVLSLPLPSTVADAPPPSGAPRTAGAAPSERIAARWTTATLDRALPWIVNAWLVGAIALMVRLAGGMLRVRRVTRRGVATATPELLAVARDVAERLGLGGAIRILVSTRVDVPMVAGWVAPVVLFPASLLTGLTSRQIEMLLAHELAHIRRYDTIVSFAAAIAESLLFYHPAVRWIARRVREEREDCCDDLAIAVTCCDRLSYGRTLLAVEEARGPALALASAATDGTLLRRVRRIVQGSPGNVHVFPGWSAVVVTTFLLTIVAVDRVAGSAIPPRVIHTASVSSVNEINAINDIRASGDPPHPSTHANLVADTLTRQAVQEPDSMTHHKVLIGAAAIAIARPIAPTSTPSIPSFAGRWTVVGCTGCADSADLAALRARGTLVPGWSPNVTVVQDATTLAVIDGTPKRDTETTYRIGEAVDGVATVTPGPNGTTRVVIRAAELALVQSTPTWTGDRLVIPMTGTRDSTSVDYRMSLSLDQNEDLLVEWAVGSVRVRVGGARIDFSPEQTPAFHGSDRITFRYRRVPATQGAPPDTTLAGVGYVVRRRGGSGFYIDGPQVDHTAERFSELVRRAPGFRVAPTGDGHSNVITDAQRDDGCVNVFVDGVLWQATTPGDVDDFVRPREVVAIEAYRESSTPRQFMSPSQSRCSTIVVWTRTRVRPENGG